MNPLLVACLNAKEESERDRLLGDLILLHVSPVVRRIMWRRLGLYVSPAGVNSNNPEAEDLYHDIITKLIGRLRELKNKHDVQEIKDLNHYVTRLAANACNDYLRAKSPARSRLKYNIRDLLSRRREFHVWKSDLQEYLCGFSSWLTKSDRDMTPVNINRLEEHLEEFKSARFPHDDLQDVSLDRIITEIFTWADAPVEMEDLVNIVALLLDVKDYPPESLDDENYDQKRHIILPTFHSDSRSAIKEMLQRLWADVRQLPPNQRDVFCFSFEDGDGANLFNLLIDSGVTTMPELAEDLNRPLEQLVVLWQRVPMDNASVAAELGATRPQVTKWRFRALRKLEKLNDLSRREK